MKVFTRAFTRKEKILIVILAVILIGLAYYYFVDRNVRSALEEAKQSIETNQAELDISNAQLLRLNSMDQELNSYEAGGASYIASYNNVNEEIAMLDRILSGTADYNISLQDPVLSGELIRRNVSIRFTVGSFDSALSVIRAFSSSDLRNIIQDISYSSAVTRDGYESVTVNMTVTFYETIVGGTPDAGLIMPVEEAPPAE